MVGNLGTLNLSKTTCPCCDIHYIWYTIRRSWLCRFHCLWIFSNIVKSTIWLFYASFSTLKRYWTKITKRSGVSQSRPIMRRDSGCCGRRCRMEGIGTPVHFVSLIYLITITRMKRPDETITIRVNIYIPTNNSCSAQQTDNIPRGILLNVLIVIEVAVRRKGYQVIEVGA